MMNTKVDESFEFNQDNLALMFYWIKERQSIYHKRLSNVPPPWTLDPVLQEHRFCNVYREYDKGTRYLIENILSKEEQDIFTVFNVIYYRKWNKISLYDFTGGLSETTDLSFLKQRVREYQKFDTPYGSAFGSDSSPLGEGEKDKIDKYFNQFSKIYESLKMDLPILLDSSPEDCYNKLRSYPGIGEFLAYQIWVDLSYWSRTPYTEEDFVVAGPGCKRGIDLVFSNKGNLSYEDCIRKIVSLQEDLFREFQIVPSETFRERPLSKQCLNIMCVENVFCEISKYIKIKEFYDGKTNKKNFRIRKFSPPVEEDSLFS